MNLGPEDEDDVDTLDEMEDIDVDDLPPELGEDDDVLDDEADPNVNDEIDDGFTISLGEEVVAGEESAPDWVKDLRKENRRLAQELADAKRGAAPKKQEVGARPKLEDFDYDEDRHADAVAGWVSAKSAAEAEEKAAAEAAQTEQQVWQTELATYAQRKAELRIPDFEEAEDEVSTKLSNVQQAIIVKGADNSAAVIYALGKHRTRLDALASIKDPVKFAFAVSKLERELKVTPKRTAPKPERRLNGGGTAPSAAGGSVQKRIDALYAKMADGGDVSTIRRQIRELEARA